MGKHNMWVMACAISAVTVAAGVLQADEARNATDGIQQQWLDAAGRLLTLTDQQKQEIRTIQADCKTKAEPLMKQVMALKHEEYHALTQSLNPEQAKKLPEVLRATWDREGQRMAAALGLNAEQKDRIAKIKEEYHPKCREQFAQKGANTPERLHELRGAFLAALAKELTDEQRVRLPFVLHEEMARMQDKTVREQITKEIAEGLGLNAEQKDQLHKIDQQAETKMEKLLADFKQLHQDEKARVEKVLTAKQREKLQELCSAKARE